MCAYAQGENELRAARYADDRCIKFRTPIFSRKMRDRRKKMGCFLHIPPCFVGDERMPCEIIPTDVAHPQRNAYFCSSCIKYDWSAAELLPLSCWLCSRGNAFHPSTYTTCSMATRTPRPTPPSWRIAVMRWAASAQRCESRSAGSQHSTTKRASSRFPLRGGATTIGSTTCPTGQLGHHFATTRPRAPCVHWSELNLKKTTPPSGHPPTGAQCPRTDFFISHQWIDLYSSSSSSFWPPCG